MPSQHSATRSTGSQPRSGSYRGRHARSSSPTAWLGQTAPILGIALASGAAIGALAERPGLPAGPASEVVGDVPVADPARADQRNGAAGRPARSGARRAATDPPGKAGTSPPVTANVWSLVGPATERTAGPTAQPSAEPTARATRREAAATTVEAEIDVPEPPEADLAAAGRPDIPPVPGCDAAVPDRTIVQNGRLDGDHLCPIGDGHRLRPDAAAAFLALDAAYHNATGDRLCVTDSYRSLSAQISLAARKPGLAARPGTSEHGWGLALDIGCGANTFDGAPHKWLVDHAAAYGWVNPEWARQGGSNPEPWHWEFDPALLE